MHDYVDSELLQQRIDIVNARDKVTQEKRELVIAALSMPFYKRIQQKGYEDILKRVEATQSWTMEKCIKKKHKDLIPEWKDEFAMFWTAFLKGECKSIKEYFINR